MDLARVFVAHGLSLRKAHEALNKITSGRPVFLELRITRNDNAIAQLQKLGVAARVLKKPAVNVREIRNRLGLSQTEFAVRFGFEVDTIQNWEQERNKPDGAALVLLKIIDKSPDVVDNALADEKICEKI